MGDAAEMLLDGTVCAGCGGYIDDKSGEGIPCFCSLQCARDCEAAGLTLTRKEKRALRAGKTYGISMRKRDARWLALAAKPNGCLRRDQCPTAFKRLKRLGYVEASYCLGLRVEKATSEGRAALARLQELAAQEK